VTKDSVELEYQLPGMIDAIQASKGYLEGSTFLYLPPSTAASYAQDDPKPQPIAASAAQTIMDKGSRRTLHRPPARDILLDFDVDHGNMAMIYMSRNLYFDACEQPLNLRKFNLGKHATAGLNLYQSGGRVHIASMSCSTPAAKIPGWKACMRGAWLTKIDDTVISNIIEAEQKLKSLMESGGSTATLLFAYPEIHPNLSHNRLPIVSLAPFSQHAHNLFNNR
jgi:hypothetical protein